MIQTWGGTIVNINESFYADNNTMFYRPKTFTNEGHKMNELDNMSNVNRCICCGEIIPEGIQICPQCAGAK